jgi:hypothetical protein
MEAAHTGLARLHLALFQGRDRSPTSRSPPATKEKRNSDFRDTLNMHEAEDMVEIVGDR